MLSCSSRTTRSSVRRPRRRQALAQRLTRCASSPYGIASGVVDERDLLAATRGEIALDQVDGGVVGAGNASCAAATPNDLPGQRQVSGRSWSRWLEAGLAIVAAHAGRVNRRRAAYPAPRSRVGFRRVEGGAHLPQPLRKPFQRHVFRQRAAAGVVLHHLADAPRAARRQRFVEMLAAETVGADVRAVAEREHAVTDVRQRVAACATRSA